MNSVFYSFNEEDFLYPVFRCPIRNIRTKIDGINSFNSAAFDDVFCLSDPEPELSTLISDPPGGCGFLDNRPLLSLSKITVQEVKYVISL